MTRKEKEVFGSYRDNAANEMIRAYNSGDKDEFVRTRDIFISLTELWNNLNDMEAGA